METNMTMEDPKVEYQVLSTQTLEEFVGAGLINLYSVKVNYNLGMFSQGPNDHQLELTWCGPGNCALKQYGMGRFTESFLGLDKFSFVKVGFSIHPRDWKYIQVKKIKTKMTFANGDIVYTTEYYRAHIDINKLGR